MDSDIETLMKKLLTDSLTKILSNGEIKASVKVEVSFSHKKQK